jgi:hypothetical protein
MAFRFDATTAMCTSTNHIEFDGQKIESPYACDPTDNELMCRSFFNTTDYKPDTETEMSSFTSQCRCSMDGDNGHCGNILGTPEYRESLVATLPILKESRCHTLDRDDMLAHKDVCGSGPTKQW